MIHLPHASTFIPSEVRADILLGDAALTAELVRLTDWHTDRLFKWARKHGATLFRNRLSRLVVDPERFVDDQEEPMAGMGQGVVYVQTSQGEPLREVDAPKRAALIANFFDPYHAALTSLVGEMLARFGECTLLDCHSFATVPLPSELNQAPHRPDICLGTDAFHTPNELVELLERALTAEGFRVERNTPFVGTFVPVAYWRRDSRVRSIMIEVRRGLYCDEHNGRPNGAFDDVQAAIERAVLTTGIGFHPSPLGHPSTAEPE